MTAESAKDRPAVLSDNITMLITQRYGSELAGEICLYVKRPRSTNTCSEVVAVEVNRCMVFALREPRCVFVIHA